MDGILFPEVYRPIGEVSMPEDAPEVRANKLSVTSIVIAAISLLLGVVSGLLVSVATNSEWKGAMDNRVKTLEAQHEHDAQTWEYIRTQNEVNGKTLSAIEATLNGRDRRTR